MRRDHRPYWFKRLQSRFNQWYCERFIRPQFDTLGCVPMVVSPRSCEIHGRNIHAGNYLHLISHPLKPIRLTTWTQKSTAGKIDIGDHCLVSPGVEITSAIGIKIGNDSMIGAECSIQDCDWHGLYNRLRPFRCSEPVELKTNVWLGQRCIVCKGVTIGENSVIGAGSVVTRNIPANVVAAGNPARVVKELNPARRFLSREFLFRKGDIYWQNQELVDEYLCGNNSAYDWLRSCGKPTIED